MVAPHSSPKRGPPLPRRPLLLELQTKIGLGISRVRKRENVRTCIHVRIYLSDTYEYQNDAPGFNEGITKLAPMKFS